MEIDQQIITAVENQINWTETPLFEFYKAGEEEEVDAALFTEVDLDKLMDEMSGNYEKYREDVEDHYQMASTTLQFLLE